MSDEEKPHADLLARLKAASEALKDTVKGPGVDVGREELGRLPSQETPRHRPKY
jgi:hypothetical protein